MTEAIIREIAQVTSDEVPRSQGARIQVLLGPEDRLPNFYTRLFTLDPGGSIPAHRHDTIEHEQVVLAGEMEVLLGTRQITVRAGQAVYIPAGCAHAYKNKENQPVRFICTVPATADYSTDWLEKTTD